MVLQRSLFDETAAERADDHMGIRGLILYRGLLDPREQTAVLAAIDAEPWRSDLKRRVQHYGYRYDYRSRSIDHSMRVGDLPPFALDIARRMFDMGLVRELPDQMIVNEYMPGQGISAHVDCEPCFTGEIVTISLGSVYEMDFIHTDAGEVRSVMLELGSALIMTGPSRYNWMHRIKARLSDHGIRRDRRVSLTFRRIILSESPAPIPSVIDTHSK
jgi:alkylated DNA repair dioxygenase AlkB